MNGSPRRARAIAIAQTQSAKLAAFRVAMLAVGATACLGYLVLRSI